MEIRRAVVKDLEEVSNILKEGRSQEPYNDELSQEESYKIVKDYFEREVMYVSSEDGKVTGFIVGSKFYWIGGWILWISEIFVSPKNRGKGVGKVLMNTLIDHFKKEGISIAELLVHRESPALKFYEKMGFKETDYIKFKKTL